MEKNNKILLFAVLIILVALVYFNFNTISGKTPYGNSILISVSPAYIDFSGGSTQKPVTVVVDAGDIGADTKFYLYYEDGSRYGGFSDNLCTDSICYGIITKTTWISSSIDSGQYFFEITRDNYGLQANSNLFEVNNP